jgi:hypothetical protein
VIVSGSPWAVAADRGELRTSRSAITAAVSIRIGPRDQVLERDSVRPNPEEASSSLMYSRPGT